MKLPVFDLQNSNRGASRVQACRACVAAVCLVLAIAGSLPVSAQTNLEKSITLDVTEATPQTVFERLARDLDCRITVDRSVRKPLTLRVTGMPASQVLAVICRSIDCEYRFDGRDLFVKRLSAARRRQAAAMEEQSRRLGSRMPPGMRFDDTPLKDALGAIGKASGLELRPWRDEGSRKVTVDVGSKTVDEALEAVIRQIDGEGIVMMRTAQGSWGQHRVVDRHP